MDQPARRDWHPHQLWLVLPSLVGASAWWFIVSQLFRGRLIFDHVSWLTFGLVIVVGVLVLGLWLGSAMLTAYVVETMLWPALIAVVVSLPMLAFFPLTVWTGLSYGLSVIGVWWGIAQARADRRTRRSVHPDRTLQHALRPVMPIMILAVAVLYFQHVRGDARSAEQVAARLSEQSVTIVEKFLPRAYPQYRPSSTVEELLGSEVPTGQQIIDEVWPPEEKTLNRSALEDKLRSLDLDPASNRLRLSGSRQELIAQLDRLFSGVRDQVIDQSAAELSQRFRVPINRTDRVHDVLVRLLNRQYLTYIGRFLPGLPAILALGLFFLLRLFQSVFHVVSVWLGWAWYGLLRLLRVWRVTEEKQSVQTLGWT